MNRKSTQGRGGHSESAQSCKLSHVSQRVFHLEAEKISVFHVRANIPVIWGEIWVIPQGVERDGAQSAAAAMESSAPKLLPIRVRFNSTNACRLRADALQMRHVTVGRSSTFDVSRTEIAYARRHETCHWAGPPVSIRHRPQSSCEVRHFPVRHLNPRPL